MRAEPRALRVTRRQGLSNGHARGRCEQLCAVLDLLSNALLLSQAVARSMFRATVPASDVLEVRRSHNDCRARPALRDGHNTQDSPIVRTGRGRCCVASYAATLELTPEDVAPSAAWHQLHVRAGARREARL